MQNLQPERIAKNTLIQNKTLFIIFRQALNYYITVGHRYSFRDTDITLLLSNIKNTQRLVVLLQLLCRIWNAHCYIFSKKLYSLSKFLLHEDGLFCCKQLS